MSHRRALAVVTASVLLLAGCGGGKVTVTSSSAKPSASTSAAQSSDSTPTEQSPGDAQPGATLDPSACTDITGANLDLAVATNAEDAQKAADVFAKYNPPADVQDAINHFVSTHGAQFDDPDFDKYNKLIDEWVKGVCPL
jgi:hypothetical protein